jgi:hypothetical protein
MKRYHLPCCVHRAPVFSERTPDPFLLREEHLAPDTNSKLPPDPRVFGTGAVQLADNGQRRVGSATQTCNHPPFSPAARLQTRALHPATGAPGQAGGSSLLATAYKGVGAASRPFRFHRLQQHPAVQNDDMMSNLISCRQIVRNVDKRDAKLLVELRRCIEDRCPQRRIDHRNRLVSND